jgi:hypothetical protein
MPKVPKYLDWGNSFSRVGPSGFWPGLDLTTGGVKVRPTLRKYSVLDRVPRNFHPNLIFKKLLTLEPRDRKLVIITLEEPFLREGDGLNMQNTMLTWIDGWKDK